MRDGYQRGTLARPATERQMDVLAAFVAAGGSVQEAAQLVGIRPSTVKRHLADLRARSGLTTEQLIYAGRASGRLVVPSLEPEHRTLPRPAPPANPNIRSLRSALPFSRGSIKSRVWCLRNVHASVAVTPMDARPREAAEWLF